MIHFNYVFILMMLQLMSCDNSKLSGKKNFTNALSITKLNIKYVDVLIETPITIRCNDFESSFDDIKNTTITDTIYLNKFQKQLKKLNPNPKGRKPDVRTKIEIYFSNGSSKYLCLEGQKGAIEYNDEVVIYDGKIVDMVYDIIK